VVEAVNGQLCHCAYHVGQMVLTGKMTKGPHWQSLGIPKTQSQAFNGATFAEAKKVAHFSDEILEKKIKH
jgi:hypothetical protein